MDDVEALNGALHNLAQLFIPSSSVFRRRIKDDFWKNRHMTEKEELTKVRCNVRVMCCVYY